MVPRAVWIGYGMGGGEFDVEFPLRRHGVPRTAGGGRGGVIWIVLVLFFLVSLSETLKKRSAGDLGKTLALSNPQTLKP